MVWLTDWLYPVLVSTCLALSASRTSKKRVCLSVCMVYMYVRTKCTLYWHGVLSMSRAYYT